MPKPRNSRSIAVEVAVVVGVAGDEAVAADAVERLDPLDDVHRERQPRDPRPAGALVGQVERRRGRVRRRASRRRGCSSTAVSRCGFCRPSGRRSAAAGARRRAAATTRPGRRCRCRAGRLTMTDDRSSTRGNVAMRPRLAPAVARLVEVDAHAVACEVDDVGGARAVDVGQPDRARWSNGPGVEPAARCPS